MIVTRNSCPAESRSSVECHITQRPVLSDLSAAEQRVLHFILAGYSNKEISAGLSRSESTVKPQVSASRQKLGQPPHCTAGCGLWLISRETLHGNRPPVRLDHWCMPGFCRALPSPPFNPILSR